MLLVCRRREAILASLEALRSWAGAGQLSSTRVAVALSRIEALRARTPRARGLLLPSVASYQAACAELTSHLEAPA
jgi:hypothetical protein